MMSRSTTFNLVEPDADPDKRESPAIDSTAAAPLTFGGNPLVQQISHAMQHVAKAFAAALSDPRLDAETLIGLLCLGQGATYAELEQNMALGVLAPGQTIQRLIDAGFAIEADEQGKLIVPTSDAHSVFRGLFKVAQRKNANWRDELQSNPSGTLVLDEFLAMLQSGRTSSKKTAKELS